LLLVAILAVAGCGSSKSSSSSGGPSVTTTGKTHLAKTKFVIHAGLAFGVFHRWIYKPFKKGDFSHPLRHKVAVIKALAAGAFVVHEVRLARNDARSSKLLSKVILPLTALGGSVALIRSGLKSGHVNSGAVTAANSDISSAKSASSAAGQPISETTAGAPAGLG
jgi:hypothetical protein